MNIQGEPKKPGAARVALIAGLIVTLCLPAFAAQKTSKPTTHSTKGTIASINGDTLVINQTVRGKPQQLTLTLNSQTQRSGDLVAGNPVTVQYRQDNNQKVATAVRESGAKSASKPAKVTSKPATKS